MKTKKAPVKVEPYDVVTPHVRVTIRHFRKEVAYLMANKPPIRERLGENSHNTLIPLIWHIDGGDSLDTFQDRKGLILQIFVCEDLRGRKLDDLVITMEARKWNDIQFLAKQIGKKPETLIRAALRCRYLQLREFHKAHGSTPEEPPSLEKFKEVQRVADNGRRQA